MTRIALLGATGSLGSQVARLALTDGHALSVLVRDPARLDSTVASKAAVTRGDLATMAADALRDFIAGHDALICCAGVVTEGQRFVTLVDRVVGAAEALPASQRPVCWFLGGAALLDLDQAGRRGVQLPKVRDTYWPHQSNFERLSRSDLDWRLLCPGPMVPQPALGLEQMRVATERLPAPLPGFANALPGLLLLPLFAFRIPEMIVPYADAAQLMLNNLTPLGPLSHKRVGLALPAGMRGKKASWAARPRQS